MKTTIFHNNDQIIIISDPGITAKTCKKTLSIFTLSSPHNTSVPKKITNLLTQYLMTYIHQKKHYHNTYKTCTAQSQQIATLAKLPAQSKL